jgi:hypothetical protein
MKAASNTDHYKPAEIPAGFCFSQQKIILLSGFPFYISRSKKNNMKNIIMYR